MPSTAIPETMTAVGFYEHGSLDNLQLLEVEVPSIGPDEVLVDVKATSLNHADVFSVRELDHYTPEYPHWGGMDVAGDVAAVGENVTGWEIGDRVVVNPFIRCLECEHCVRGDFMFCRNRKTMGEHRRGGFAEYVDAPQRYLIALPDHVSYEEAAAVPIAGGTAYRALMRRGDLQADDELLIVGATGGVGTYAVQIANEICNVDTLYGTTSTDEKAEFLSDLGVDHVIDYTEESFDERIWDLTDKRGVDVVYDNVGGPAWTKSMRSLHEGGRLVTSGATAGPNPETEMRLIFIRALDIRGSSGADPGDLQRLFDYVFDGTIESIVQETMPLDEYERAYEMMAERELYGKVALVQE